MIWQELSNMLLFGTSSEGPIESHAETMNRIPEFIKNWKGDVKKLYLLADRLEKVGEAIRKEIVEMAGVEMSLLYGDEKKQTLYGNTITYSVSPVYEFVDTPQIKTLEEDLDEIAKQIEPFKKKEQQIKKAISSEKERQIMAGEAKRTKNEYKLSVSRK